MASAGAATGDAAAAELPPLVPIEELFPMDPFIAAAIAGDSKAVADAIAANKDVITTTDARGWSAMHHAAHWGQVAVLALLKEHGADVDAVTHNRETALHTAAQVNKVAAIKKLIELGARIEEDDSSLQRPMHQACLVDGVESVEALLAAGATFESKDRNGKTVLDVAREFKAEKVIAVLEKQLAAQAAAHKAEEDKETVPVILEKAAAAAAAAAAAPPPTPAAGKGGAATDAAKGDKKDAATGEEGGFMGFLNTLGGGFLACGGTKR